MPTCENCGSFVTENYVRVFGDRNGEVYACPHCRTRIQDPQAEGNFRKRRSSAEGNESTTYDPTIGTEEVSG